MPIKTDMQRRRKVWDFKAQHPELSGDEIAARLNLAPRTVYKDIEAAEIATNDRAVAGIRAAILTRNFQLIEANMPFALLGKVRNTEAVLACHKELRELFGIDAPKEARLTVDIRQMAERMAPLYGLSVDEVVAEAENILRASQEVGS
jgi:hypothetical protein